MGVGADTTSWAFAERARYPQPVGTEPFSDYSRHGSVDDLLGHCRCSPSSITIGGRAFGLTANRPCSPVSLKLQSQVGTLQLKILKLQQELEHKTSNQKGDKGEVDLFRLLKEAFAEDKKRGTVMPPMPMMFNRQSSVNVASRSQQKR